MEPRDAAPAQGQVAVVPLIVAAPEEPQETTQAFPLPQLVTVQPLAGQLTMQPLAGHSTTHRPDVWQETLQLDALLQSTSQLGALLHATLHAEPAWQVRSQSSAALHTQVFGSLQVSSSEPHPAVKARVKERMRKERNELKGVFTLCFLGRRWVIRRAR